MVVYVVELLPPNSHLMCHPSSSFSNFQFGIFMLGFLKIGHGINAWNQSFELQQNHIYEDG